MAVRRPLVVVLGQVTELPTGDSLPGSAAPYSVTIGDGSAWSYTVTHNLGTVDVTSKMVLVSTGEEVDAFFKNTSINTTVVNFATAPASNAYRVTCRA
jgi:hypothetical protein